MLAGAISLSLIVNYSLDTLVLFIYDSSYFSYFNDLALYSRTGHSKQHLPHLVNGQVISHDDESDLITELFTNTRIRAAINFSL